MSGREPYGGGEIERNHQNQSPSSYGSVYKPIMPPNNTPNSNANDDANLFHHLPLHLHHHHQDMAAGAAVVGGSGGLGLGMDGIDMMNVNMNVGMNNHAAAADPIKRKRGRPRKYSPPSPPTTTTAAHPNIGLDLTSPPHHHSPLLYPCGGGFQSPPSPASASNNTSNTAKKPRGRPPGSGRKINHPSTSTRGSGGSGFTPHLITVNAGEDVLLKVMSFSQNGPRGVCILSAYGAISNVTLRQAATSGGTVTYEGRFEILSLSGSFLLSDNGGQRSRTGGLSVLLSGPDGRVLGGGVAGLLTAASSVQIIVGSFMSEDSKGSKLWINQPETMSAPGASVAGSPPSRGTFSESSGGPGSPPNQSTGACNNSNPQGIPNMTWK